STSDKQTSARFQGAAHDRELRWRDPTLPLRYVPAVRGRHSPCPLPLLEQMESKLREFAARRKGLIEAFLTAYPTLCQDAAKRLRSLYNPTDYPPLEFVAQQFTLIWQYISFGVPDHLREISTQLWHAERHKAEER